MSAEQKPNPHGEPPAAEQTVQAALEKGLANVRNPADAERTLDELESVARGPVAEAAAPTPSGLSLNEQAHEIESAGEHASKKDQPAAILAEAARQIAGATPADKAIFDQAITHASGPPSEEQGTLYPAPKLVRGRRLLRKAMMRRLRPLSAIDAMLFLEINRLPHPPVVDRWMLRFTNIMNRGDGWLILLAVLCFFDKNHGLRAVRGVAPVLWLATATVEYPIKHFFQRRRPFLALVRAIIVGRKPGSFSFPSGHSAAAFAGAYLLQRYYPGGRPIFRAIATLVGFSRIYLGAHYPGDVVTGAVTGTLVARLYRNLFGRLARRLGR